MFLYIFTFLSTNFFIYLSTVFHWQISKTPLFSSARHLNQDDGKKKQKKTTDDPTKLKPRTVKCSRVHFNPRPWWHKRYWYRNAHPAEIRSQPTAVIIIMEINFTSCQDRPLPWLNLLQERGGRVSIITIIKANDSPVLSFLLFVTRPAIRLSQKILLTA